jgi:putative transposase
MSERYQISDQDSPVDSQQLAAFLAKDGQLLLPMVELVEQAQCAVDEVVDVMGRATIEAILQMSAAQLAGPKQQGKAADREVASH